MRGVAEKSHTRHALPSMSARKRMDSSEDGIRLAVGDQRGELGCPAIELRRDSRPRLLGVGEVDARDPVQGLGERDVGVQDAVGLAVGLDAFDPASPLDGSIGQRVEKDAPQVAAKHFGASGAAVVGLVEKEGAVRVEHPRRLAAFMDDSAEFAEQSGGLQRELSVVVMDVELAPCVRASADASAS